MANVSEHKLFQSSSCEEAAGKWQPVAGFTWELLLIGFAWSIAFATVPIVVLWIKGGAYPGNLFWLGFWGYIGLTYKFIAWLSDKYRERQKKVLMSAQELLKHDRRPHVLYLRAFRDDETTSRLLNLSTEEQELAVTMRDIGPFIAFGNPSEQVSEPGAARMYVEHEHWQEVVADLMTSARLVVGRIANSDGFLWEISTAVKLIGPERLLLLLPANKEEYEEFRERAKRLFPCKLPEHKFKARHSESHLSSEGYLCFGPDWTPRLQVFTSARLRQNFWIPGVPIYKLALRPVFEQLGVDWKRPPLQPLMVLAVLLLIVFALITIYVGGLQIMKLWELIASTSLTK